MQLQRNETPTYKKAIQLVKPTQLPYGVFLALFGNKTVTYKGRVLSPAILPDLKGDLCRGICVGDYLYSAQSTIGFSAAAKQARAGTCIMYIHKISTKKLLAKVVNGKVKREV